MATPPATKEIETLLQEGYRVDVGKHLSRGFELLKSQPTEFLGFGALIFFVSFILAWIPLVGPLITAFVIGPLATAGLLHVVFELLRGRSIVFNDFFKITDKIGVIVLAGVLTQILTIIGFVLCILPGLYAIVALCFTYPLIVARRIDPVLAIGTSLKVVNKNLGEMILLVLVACGIMLAGVLVLGVGIIVAYPLVGCLMGSAYAEIFGLDGISAAGESSEADADPSASDHSAPPGSTD